LLSSHTITYAYDSLYRVTNANYSTGSVFTYTYDEVGNRLTQTTLTNTTVYTYDNANRLTNVNGVAQIWDDNGNLVNDGASTYAYDSANRLITVTQGANVYAFAYNGQGDRLRQTVNGAVTTYTLDLNAGLTQVLADGANTYLYGTMRIGEQQAGGFAYYLSDALGSVRQVANASANVTLAKSYEPFGAVMTSAGSGTSIFGWAGEARDASGLVFLRARYYSVTTGRFFARDSWPGNVQMPGTLHPYLYTGGNPVNAADPSGHICIWGNDIPPVSILPCTSQQVAEAIAQQQAIGKSIRYAKQFGEMFAGDPSKTAALVHLNAAASFWQTDFVQTPINNRDVLLGYKQADAWERLDASSKCAFSTALPIAGYALIPYATVRTLTQAFALSDDLFAPRFTDHALVKDALKVNYQGGLDLYDASALPQEYINFFETGGTEGTMPETVPVDALRNAIKDIPGVKGAYVVGKPVLGSDLDLVIFGQDELQLSQSQLTMLKSIADQSGFNGIDPNAIRNYNSLRSVATLRFATQATTVAHSPTDMQAAWNLRNTMLWRRLFP
jgi:RHS repeat-associated protein